MQGALGMEMKFTPGPWRASAASAVVGSLVTAQHKWPNVAAVMQREVIGECEANAHLIAAAPELLEALRKAETFIAEETDTRETSCLPGPTEDEEGYLGQAHAALKACREAIAKATGGA